MQFADVVNYIHGVVLLSLLAFYQVNIGWDGLELAKEQELKQEKHYLDLSRICACENVFEVSHFALNGDFLFVSKLIKSEVRN